MPFPGGIMNFETTEKIDFYLPKVKAFVEDHVIPVEKEIHAQDRPLEERWQPHPELEPLKEEAKKQGLAPIQLFNLKQDKGERNNLQAKNKAKVKELIEVLDTEVKKGRSSPGKPVPNDREVSYLPRGFTMSKSN